MFCLSIFAGTCSYTVEIAVVPLSIQFVPCSRMIVVFIHFVPCSRLIVVFKCVRSSNMYLNLKVCDEGILSATEGRSL